MYPRQNQNTDDKTKDVQKEIAAENEIGNNSFQTNNINNLLNSGNENAIKLIIASAEEEDKED